LGQTDQPKYKNNKMDQEPFGKKNVLKKSRNYRNCARLDCDFNMDGDFGFVPSMDSKSDLEEELRIEDEIFDEIGNVILAKLIVYKD